jgi:hypothetical protein
MSTLNTRTEHGIYNSVGNHNVSVRVWYVQDVRTRENPQTRPRRKEKKKKKKKTKEDGMKGILYIQRAPSRLCCFRLLSWGNGRTMAMYTDSRERLADLRGDALNANHALRSLSHVHSSGGGTECRRPRKEISFFFQPRCIISFAIGRPSSGAYSLHIKPFRRRPYLLFFFFLPAHMSSDFVCL